MPQKPEFVFEAQEKKFYARNISFNMPKFWELAFNGTKAFFTGNPSDAIGAVKNLLGITKVKSDLGHEAAIALFSAWFDCLGHGLEKIPTGLNLNKIKNDDITSDLKTKSFDIGDIGERFLEDTEFFKNLSLYLRELLSNHGVEPHIVTRLDEYIRNNFSRHLRFILSFYGESFPKFKQLYFEIQASKDQWQKESDIANYREEVKRNFTTRQILEGIFLKDVYIVPRCQVHLDRDKENEINLQKGLIETVLGLLETDRPLIVLGEPGYGKTSFTSNLGHYLTSHPDLNWFPVMAEFKSLKPELGLKGLSLEAETYLSEDLAKKKRVLYILDGMDEIIGATASPATYKEFIGDLLKKVDLFQRNHAGGNVLITSRTKYFEAHKSWLPAEYPYHQITLKGFDDDQISQWLDKFKKFNHECDVTLEALEENNLLKETRDQKEGIARLPVILTMIVDTFPKLGKSDAIGKLQTQSLFNVYQAIVDRMFIRELEKRLSHPDRRLPFNSPDEFSQFLERIACIIFQQGTTQLDYRTIRDNWKKYGSFKPLPTLDEYDDEQWKLQLLFYFKSHKDNDGELSQIEFIHKSFFDYFIVKSLHRFLINLERRLNEKEDPETEETAFELMKIVSGMPLEYFGLNLLGQGFNNLKEKETFDEPLISNYLLQVFQEMNDHHFLGCAKIQQLFGQDLFPRTIHTLANLYSILHEINPSGDLQFWDLPGSIARMQGKTKENEKNGFYRFVSYLNSLENNYFLNYKLDFNNVNFSNQSCSTIDLSEIKADMSKWNNANLSKTNLYGAQFVTSICRGANLREANLQYSLLWGVDFSNAILIKADLSRSIIGGICSRTENSFSVYSGVNRPMRKGEFVANLSKAVLIRANLKEARLSGVNFSYADLLEANMAGTKLEKTNFSQANLSGANLDKAKSLTQDQVDQAYVNEETVLPRGLDLKLEKRTQKSYFKIFKRKLNIYSHFEPDFILYDIPSNATIYEPLFISSKIIQPKS